MVLHCMGWTSSGWVALVRSFCSEPLRADVAAVEAIVVAADDVFAWVAAEAVFVTVSCGNGVSAAAGIDFVNGVEEGEIEDYSSVEVAVTDSIVVVAAAVGAVAVVQQRYRSKDSPSRV